MRPRNAMARMLHARVYDGTADVETRTLGPATIQPEEVGGMGQREDVQASLNGETHDRREAPARRADRVGLRAGWRARLAHVEHLLTEVAARPVRGSKLDQALAEIRSMLDEIPQIGPSQRAPIEVPPVRESER